MEAQTSREKYPSAEFNYVKQFERKSRKYRSSKPSSYREATINRSLKSPMAITIARRQQSNVSPMITSSFESSENNTFTPSNPFAFAKNEVPSHKANRSKSKSNSSWKSEAAPPLARAIWFPIPSRSSEKQPQYTNAGRSCSSRRNLTLRQTARSDQKKRKIGEKAVKTFAQIVATGTANAKTHHREQK